MSWLTKPTSVPVMAVLSQSASTSVLEMIPSAAAITGHSALEAVRRLALAKIPPPARRPEFPTLLSSSRASNTIALGLASSNRVVPSSPVMNSITGSVVSTRKARVCPLPTHISRRRRPILTLTPYFAHQHIGNGRRDATLWTSSSGSFDMFPRSSVAKAIAQ